MGFSNADMNNGGLIDAGSSRAVFVRADVNPFSEQVVLGNGGEPDPNPTLEAARFRYAPTAKTKN
jgi:hypothetical protein